MGKYKQLIFAIIIIIIIVILDIIFENISNNRLSEIKDKLALLDKMIDVTDKSEEGRNMEATSEEDVESYSKQIVKTWDGYQTFLACYIEHDEVEKIGDKLKLIEKQVQIEEFRRLQTSYY